LPFRKPLKGSGNQPELRLEEPLLPAADRGLAVDSRVPDGQLARRIAPPPMGNVRVLLGSLAVAGILPHTAQAVVVNLLDPATPAASTVTWDGNSYTPVSSGIINDAVFSREAIGAGTGNLYPFLRLNGTDIEQGYNTSKRPLPFDADASWTRSLQLYQVPVVTLGATRYFQFNLDVNEPNNANRYISLDKVQVYSNPTEPTTPPTDPNLLGTLRYSLDAGNAANRVLLDGGTPGSGVSDMIALIPLEKFKGANTSDFVFLYSLFGELGAVPGVDPPTSKPNDGDAWYNDSGFEEWSVVEQAKAPPGTVYLPPGTLIDVPEPWEFGVLFGLGSLALVWQGKRASRRGDPQGDLI
jgi:hypothetical protein